MIAFLKAKAAGLWSRQHTAIVAALLTNTERRQREPMPFLDATGIAAIEEIISDFLSTQH